MQSREDKTLKNIPELTQLSLIIHLLVSVLQQPYIFTISNFAIYTNLKSLFLRYFWIYFHQSISKMKRNVLDSNSEWRTTIFVFKKFNILEY